MTNITSLTFCFLTVGENHLLHIGQQPVQKPWQISNVFFLSKNLKKLFRNLSLELTLHELQMPPLNTNFVWSHSSDVFEIDLLHCFVTLKCVLVWHHKKISFGDLVNIPHNS